MADTKISALTAIAAVAGEDLFAVVDDPAGTPTTTKATVTQLQTFLESALTLTESQISDLGAYLTALVGDTTPQLGGQLDVNGQALGDGTLELVTFTEDASAVNHVNIENEATGGGPIISAAGDDINVDLNLAGKGSGVVNASGSRVLTTADEGTGNGLDADTVDGSEASALLARANHTGTQTASTVSDFDTQVQTTRVDQLANPTAARTMNSQKLTGLAAGTGAGDSLRYEQVVGLYLLLTGGTLSGAIAMGSNKITGLGAPTAVGDAARLQDARTQWFGIALSDETTAITTGTNKATMSLPFAATLLDCYATLNTVSSSGIPTVDINEAGTTVLSTKLTIDANEKTSATAATAHVISDSAIAANAEIGFDIDVAGTGAKGLKVFIRVQEAV